ncbi:hypothetical protein [Spirillospora sp. NPDC029432]|uniref:hypothetical protein n=1 Tax=Spirillospora sp. NPDC029432 TaxID=3154599 RepID=UPI0034567F0F
MSIASALGHPAMPLRDPTPAPSPGAPPPSTPTPAPPSPTPEPTSTVTPGPSSDPDGGGGDGGGGCANPQACEPPEVDSGGGFLGFDPIGDLANSLRDGTIWMLEKLASFWVEIDTPAISNQDPMTQTSGVTATGSVAWLQGELTWFVGAAAVLGLLLAAGRMAWHRRGEPLQQALSGLLTLAVVTGCSVAAITIATEAGDEFSEWIIEAAIGADTDFGGAINQMLWSQAALGSTGLLIILFLLCILASLAQIALLYIRFAMLGLLVGFLPLAAGMTVVPEGKAWFKKMLGWLVAFLLYKPVAACIYAYAFISLKAPDGTSQIVGIILIILAVVALPALMRFVVPMVSAAGETGSGWATAAGGAGGSLMGRMGESGSGGGDGGGPTGARPADASGGGATGSAPPPSPDQSDDGAGQGGTPDGADQGTPSSTGDGGGQSGEGEGAAGADGAVGVTSEAGTASSSAGTTAASGSGTTAASGAGATAAGGAATAGVGVAATAAQEGHDAAKGAAENATGESADGAKQ